MFCVFLAFHRVFTFRRVCFSRVLKRYIFAWFSPSIAAIPFAAFAGSFGVSIGSQGGNILAVSQARRGGEVYL